MSSIKSHTAAGQLAGFLFQPERALYHLATSSLGSVVGIETLDDVAVIQPNGLTTYEQDKHSVSAGSQLADSSVGLWKTLNIWLSAVADGEIDLAHADLHVVTNKVLTRGLAWELMHSGREKRDLAKLLALLRQAARRVPPSTRPMAIAVATRKDTEIQAVLKRVRVIDGTGDSFGRDLKKALASNLPLPPGQETEVLQSLLGWIHETTLELIRQGKPAWLTREAFLERYFRILGSLQDRRFLHETAEALILVPPEKRAAHRQRLFVTQLLWLGLPEDDDQLVDAIDDYIRSTSERIRLAKAGTATLSDFRTFEERLTSRWKNIFRKHSAGLARGEAPQQQQCGKAILYDTLDHREPLGGYETLEWYLTRGAYHRLADRPAEKPHVGWHPAYEQKCKDLPDQHK